jgi:hypothetical protein
MRWIPVEIKSILDKDPFMTICCHCGDTGKMYLHRPFIYGGEHITQAWSIIPLCRKCRHSKPIAGDFSKLMVLLRMTDLLSEKELDQIKKIQGMYNWESLYDYLFMNYYDLYQKQAQNMLKSNEHLKKLLTISE